MVFDSRQMTLDCPHFAGRWSRDTLYKIKKLSPLFDINYVALTVTGGLCPSFIFIAGYHWPYHTPVFRFTLFKLVRAIITRTCFICAIWAYELKITLDQKTHVWYEAFHMQNFGYGGSKTGFDFFSGFEFWVRICLRFRYGFRFTTSNINFGSKPCYFQFLIKKYLTFYV